jgi:hypothetical protein
MEGFWVFVFGAAIACVIWFGVGAINDYGNRVPVHDETRHYTQDYMYYDDLLMLRESEKWWGCK